MNREQKVIYIAGFFDGEGCIVINVNQTGYAYVQCIIGQRNPEPLELIKEVFGGGAVRKVTAGKNGQHHSLNVNGYKAYTMLAELLPYLIVKRSQAELAIQFRIADEEERAEIKTNLRLLKRVS
jgi:hypothetical protein